jgi:hypothetical protein
MGTVQKSQTTSPFVIIGHAGSLQLIRELGFSTFDHCIDSGYDNDADPVRRISKAIESSLQFIHAIKTNKIKIDDLLDQRVFNVNWAKNKFLDFYHTVHTRKILEYCKHENVSNK